MAICKFMHGFCLRKLIANGTLGALMLLLFAPAPLAGDGFKVHAATESQVIRVRSLLEQQELSLDAAGLDQLARSIVEESRRHAHDVTLLLALIHVESRFDHEAVSSQGAQGLMQIRPIAVSALVEEARIPRSAADADLKDPAVNVRLGASYLAHLIELFGDLKVSLTAYNQGPTRVRNQLAAREQLSFAYADKVLSVQRVFERETANSGAA
jgi:soluble lytic murein transglycosylase-like protein